MNEQAELDKYSDYRCSVQSCQKPLTWREYMNGLCGACGTIVSRQPPPI